MELQTCNLPRNWPEKTAVLTPTSGGYQLGLVREGVRTCCSRVTVCFYTAVLSYFSFKDYMCVIFLLDRSGLNQLFSIKITFYLLVLFCGTGSLLRGTYLFYKFSGSQKLYMDFLLHRGLAPLTPTSFKVQPYISCSQVLPTILKAPGIPGKFVLVAHCPLALFIRFQCPQVRSPDNKAS